MSEATVPKGLGLGSGITRVLSDDRLAQRAVGGDERAFAAIFGRYHQSLYRYCLAIVGDAQDAQDALQSTMLKVLGALPGEERRVRLKPWLYRIAHNESIELLRRRRETHRLDPELGEVGSGLAEEAASRERLRRLISDLDELPERQRGALVMRELAGLDFAEIGTALGTSPAAARQALYEARLSLQKMDEGREMSCEVVTKALSDGDGRVSRRRDLRAHLRTCASCRGFRGGIEGRERDLAALSPLPAVAAAGLLQGLFGGNGAGGGVATALAGGTAKSLGVSTALKGAATVTVVVALGIGAVDRGSSIDVELPGGGGSQATRAEQPAGAGGSAGTQPTRSGSPAISATVGSVAVARGAGQLDVLETSKSGTEKVATSDGAKANAEADPAPASQSNSVAHPEGEGPGKQLPDASAHGQQTAASHKSSDHGPSRIPSHPEHPSKPVHPPTPPNPGTEKKSSSPPSSPAMLPETPVHGNGATHAGGAKEAPPGHGAGKQP